MPALSAPIQDIAMFVFPSNKISKTSEVCSPLLLEAELYVLRGVLAEMVPDDTKRAQILSGRQLMPGFLQGSPALWDFIKNTVSLFPGN